MTRKRKQTVPWGEGASDCVVRDINFSQNELSSTVTFSKYLKFLRSTPEYELNEILVTDHKVSLKIPWQTLAITMA